VVMLFTSTAVVDCINRNQYEIENSVDWRLGDWALCEQLSDFGLRCFSECRREW
jgi:hypothetical protein